MKNFKEETSAIEFISFMFKNDYEVMFEKAIKFKFPKIKNLEINMNSEYRISIRFDDDGIHTKKMIIDYLNELRNL